MSLWVRDNLNWSDNHVTRKSRYHWLMSLFLCQYEVLRLDRNPWKLPCSGHWVSSNLLSWQLQAGLARPDGWLGSALYWAKKWLQNHSNCIYKAYTLLFLHFFPFSSKALIFLGLNRKPRKKRVSVLVIDEETTHILPDNLILSPSLVAGWSRIVTRHGAEQGKKPVSSGFARPALMSF